MESLEVQVSALEVLVEEVKSLGLKVSWANTKVQSLGSLLDNTVHPVHACGEDIKLTKSFTYLDNVVYDNDGFYQEVT